MKASRTKSLFALISIAVVTHFFTNCGVMPQEIQVDMASESPTNDIDKHHPAPETPTEPPEQKLQLVSRQYVAAILKENFTSTQTPVSNLDAIVDTWVTYRPGSFGSGCDLNGSFAGQDCGGDFSNTGISPALESSALRSSYKIQVCEQILSQNNAISAIREKIVSTSATPNASSVGQLYSLFRRGWDPDPGVVSTIVEFDRDLALKRVHVIDRWRMVILMICEDPFWEAP